MSIRRHFSVAQKVIGLLTGVITIIGAAYSVYKFVNPTPDTGQIEARIQDGDGNPVSGAKVEILSADKAIVGTLQTDQDGRIKYTVKDGRYDLRTSHDGFLPSTRDVQVTAGKSVDVAVRLVAAPSVKGVQNTFKKIIGR
jgi:5-hydroxyisourate hydrolase-like protein (transthyretin family)